MKKKTDIEFDASKLRGEMKKRGLRFLTLARALQVHEPKCSKQIVWKWATGKASPRSNYLHALSSVLEKPMEFFFKK